MKKVLFTFSLIIHCFLFPFSIYAQDISFREDSKMEKIHVSTKLLTGKSDTFEYHIQIPVFSLKDEKLQKKLNRHLEKDILSFKKQLEKDAKNASLLAKQNGWDFRPYSTTITYKITYHKKGVLSFILSYYQYTGGAHGIESWNAYNIHLRDGSNIELADCFQKDSSYKEMIQQEIIRQIKQNPSIYFPDAEQKVSDTKDFHFYIDDTGFVVYFPLYEIAPYASGIPTFSIPFTLCQEMLN